LAQITGFQGGFDLEKIHDQSATGSRVGEFLPRLGLFGHEWRWQIRCVRPGRLVGKSRRCNPTRLGLASGESGEPASQMYTFDLNQDGKMDVFAASAHERGIWYYENQGDGSNQKFTRHVLTEEMSETHAVAFA